MLKFLTAAVCVCCLSLYASASEPIRGLTDDVDQPQVKWSGLVSFVAADAPKTGAKKCDCDCCKPTCKCEPGKRDPQCKCYPCPATKEEKKLTDARPQSCCADIKFTEIGFVANADGSEGIAFVRTKGGLEIGADEFKGKDLFLVSDLGFDSKPVTVKQLHDWASQTVGTSYITVGNEVYFFGSAKVAKSSTTPVTAPPAIYWPTFPATPSCPNCQGGSCPKR